MRMSVFAGLLAVSTLQAADGISLRTHKLYYASVTALVVANILDIHSSIGCVETNPLLRDSAGRFSGRGIAVKVSLSTAVVASQFIFRKLHNRRNDKDLALV